MVVTTAVSSGPSIRRSYFHVWMAAAMLAAGLIGFAPTFWLPMSRGAYTSPVIIIHAILAGVVLMRVLRPAISLTPVWHATAVRLLSLAGGSGS